METEITSLQNRNTAYELYLQGYMPKEIEKKTGLNIHTIRTWVSIYHWKQSRDELQNEMQQNYKIQLRQTLMENRIKTTIDHMRLGEHLEKAVSKGILDEHGELKDLSISQIQDACRAGKDATSIRARAVGMSDKVDPLAEEVRRGSIIISVGMKAKPASAIMEANDINVETDAEFTVVEVEDDSNFNPEYIPFRAEPVSSIPFSA